MKKLLFIVISEFPWSINFFKPRASVMFTRVKLGQNQFKTYHSSFQFGGIANWHFLASQTQAVTDAISLFESFYPGEKILGSGNDSKGSYILSGQ